MKNLIIAALLGTLTETEAIQLQNIKKNIKLERVNILAQLSSADDSHGKGGNPGDELGIPGLGAGPAKASPAEEAVVAAAEGKEASAPAAAPAPAPAPAPAKAAEPAKLAQAESKEEKKEEKKVEKKEEKKEEKVIDVDLHDDFWMHSPAEPNSHNPPTEAQRNAVAIEAQKAIADDLAASRKADDEYKIRKAHQNDKSEGKKAAEASEAADKAEEDRKALFPSVTECAPFKVQVEDGLERLDGVRGKSAKQELLGRCQDKWAWELANGKQYKASEPSLEKIAEEKAAVERFAEQQEWNQDNWNMNKNQHNDVIQQIISNNRDAAIKKQQEIESFIIYPTDTPDVMKEKKERIEKRNLQQLAQAKAEFDAELDQAYKLKQQRDAEKVISDKMQADAQEKAEKEKAAYAKMIEDAEVVEQQKGLTMAEMTAARKSLNQARIDRLDRERFEYARKIKKEEEDMYKRVHSEFKSVQHQMDYNERRRREWASRSLKTTNDELWTEHMPQYIIAEDDKQERAILEKEFRMHEDSLKKSGKDATEEEKAQDDDDVDEKKESKSLGKEEKKEKKEEKKEDAKEEAKEEKKGEEKKAEKAPSEKEQKIQDAAAGVQAADQTAANAAAETDEERYYADWKVEALNKEKL